MRTSRDVAVLFCLLLMTACGSRVAPSPSAPSTSVPSPGSAASVGPAGSVNVVLGLYSGRPDPEWTLTTEQAAALLSALAILPSNTGVPPIGGLGYHGFTILVPGSTLVAYRGVVASPGGGMRSVMTDPTRGIERYLLETSRLHVTADEFTAVERALAGP